MSLACETQQRTQLRLPRFLTYRTLRYLIDVFSSYIWCNFLTLPWKTKIIHKQPCHYKCNRHTQYGLEITISSFLLTCSVLFEELLLWEFLMWQWKISKMLFSSLAGKWACDTLKKGPPITSPLDFASRIESYGNENSWNGHLEVGTSTSWLSDFLISFKASFSLLNHVVSIVHTRRTIILQWPLHVKWVLWNSILVI